MSNADLIAEAREALVERRSTGVFDLTLPTGPGVVTQRAVVFTALGGLHAGERVYVPESEHMSAGWLDWYATKYLPPECNARVMVRTVTCGEWEDA